MTLPSDGAPARTGEVLDRLLPPIAAVLLSFLLLVTAAGLLARTSLSETTTAALLSAATSLLLLVFGVAVWRRLPGHERRVTVAVKRGWRNAVLTGVAAGVALVGVATGIVAAGAALDPVVERRLEDVETIGPQPWQIAVTLVTLILLAPVSEELLFRGLMLRALVRRFAFWVAAALSALLFTAAHIDAYVLWPRAVSIFLTGLVLAVLARSRGLPAAVTAHAVVNAVVAVALVASR